MLYASYQRNLLGEPPGETHDEHRSVRREQNSDALTENRNARIKEGIHAALEASHILYPAVAAPPFESIRLPKGVIVRFVREDGSILTTANVW